MTETQATAAALILAPVVILGLVGMVRGYHLILHVYRPRKKREEDQ